MIAPNVTRVHLLSVHECDAAREKDHAANQLYETAYGRAAAYQIQ